MWQKRGRNVATSGVAVLSGHKAASLHNVFLDIPLKRAFTELTGTQKQSQGLRSICVTLASVPWFFFQVFFLPLSHAFLDPRHKGAYKIYISLLMVKGLQSTPAEVAS